MADNHTTSRCIYCNKTFAHKRSLDDHVIKVHPEFIASVSSKIHKCTHCTFKTTIATCMREHLVVKHPEMAGNRIFSRCIYCNNTFTSKLALDDHIVKKHPDFITAVSKKVHECTKCPYKTVITSHLKEHTLAKHPGRTFNCIYCDKTFTTKLALDDHIVKIHPDFITSVSRTVHECTKCAYKTVSTHHLKKHIIVNHPDIGDNRVTSTCIYCDKTFVRKETLDEHILKTHPDFIASVSRKVHECTECTFKTISNSQFRRHMVTHSDNRIPRCIHCNKTFASKQALDGHIIRRHPDFIASVSAKVHECTKCTYKTVNIAHLKRHIKANHPVGGRRHRIPRCIHCNKTFASKQALDGHIIRKHPEFIASVSAKVHECTKCTYKTVNTIHLKRHIKANHPDIADNSTTKRCIHCNRTFASKQTLDDHIVKRHPDFITSVSGKVHECTKCTYKTANTTHLKEHILANRNRVTSTCIYCNKTFVRKETLNDHIVKSHPDFIASVSKKVHECTKCSFKTISASNLKEHMTFLRKQTLDDHMLKAHPDFLASVGKKVHECTKCTYKTVSITNLKKHMVNHHNRITKTCIYCNKTFVREQTLDDHILKTHPDFITSVSRTVHECTKCTYKTVRASYLKEHILVNHPDIAVSTCIYCNKIFVRKETLDDHIVRTHPDFITSVSRKVLECTKCSFKTINTNKLKEHILAKHPDFTASIARKVLSCPKCAFKTTISRNFQRHLLEHPETAVNYKFSVCIHCTEPFKSITMLDEHIIKKHPSSIPSITRKIHKCTTCDFSTTIHTEFKRHQLKHTDTYINRKSNICVHCNKSFLSKSLLDDHIVKKHPSFICSVTSKIRECTKCSYKTTIAGDLKKHMVQHPDVGDNEIFNRCVGCDKTFIHKRALDEHIIMNHPSYISSVTSKIHECTNCNFKTTKKSAIRGHICQNVEVTALMLS
nr:unnamed protein product [Callosobruchus analis]